jgi:hypothetical protein
LEATAAFVGQSRGFAGLHLAMIDVSTGGLESPAATRFFIIRVTNTRRESDQAICQLYGFVVTVSCPPRNSILLKIDVDKRNY